MSSRTFVLIGLLAGAGCALQPGAAPEDEPDPLDPPPATAPIPGRDGLSHNGLSQNRLSLNRLSLNALSLDRLALNESGLEATTEGRELLSYVVRCALPEGERLHAVVGGVRYNFPGLLGFAPEWLDGGCGTSCQRWVSACLLAHVNAYGVSVPISVRASRAIVTSPYEIDWYWVQEGAFWGNVFGDQPEMYACIGEHGVTTELDDDPSSWLSKRVCASWDSDMCGFQFAGPCSDFEWPDKACHDLDGVVGYYSGCDGNQGPGGGGYQEVITIYLQR